MRALPALLCKAVAVSLLLTATSHVSFALDCVGDALVGQGDDYDDFGCSLDAAPDGRVWVVWTGYDDAQGDEEVFYSIFGPGGWSQRERVHPDNATDDRFPKLSIGEDGVPWVVWNNSAQGGYEIRVAHWEDGDWSQPEELGSGADRYDTYDLLSRNSGEVWFATDAELPGTDYREVLVYRWDGSSWQEPSRLGWLGSIDQNPSLEFHPDGSPWVVWNAWYYDDNISQIVCSAHGDTGWTQPEIVDDHPCDIGVPDITFDGADPVVLWVGNACTGTQTDVEYSVRRSGVWSAPSLVNSPDGPDDYDFNPRCARGYDGSVWVTWWAGNTTQFYSPDVTLSRWEGTGWSLEQVVSQPGPMKRDRYPDLAISPIGELWLAWQCHDRAGDPPYDEDIRSATCSEVTPVDFGALGLEYDEDAAQVAVSWYAGGSAASGPFYVWRCPTALCDPSTTLPPIAAAILNEEAVATRPYAFLDSEVEHGASYFYWVEWRNQEAPRFLGPARADIVDSSSFSGIRWQLLTPNPTARGACVEYEQHRPGSVSLDVYSVSGRHIASVSGHRTHSPLPSRGKICWDGLDASSLPVAGGVYLVRLALDGEPAHGRVERLTVVR